MAPIDYREYVKYRPNAAFIGLLAPEVMVILTVRRMRR